jgi:4'-phosphopantetheinyl transferase EntD
MSILRELFGDEIRVAEMDPRSADTAALLPAESAVVADAVDRRRREFASGRFLARRLFAQLDLPDGLEVGVGRNGCPLWPDGIVGSITHTASWAAVAVAPREIAGAVGCDLEKDHPLPSPLWKVVCSPLEQRFLAGRPAAERGRLATLLFSIKECLFKAQYPITGRTLRFHDVEVELETGSGQFTAVLQRNAGPLPRGRAVAGRFRFHRGLVATAVVLPPDRAAAGAPPPSGIRSPSATTVAHEDGGDR